MESTPDNRLCDICATIPFLELHATAQESKVSRAKPPSWSFGTVSDVRGRGYCPFCRLVYEGLRRGLPDDSDVKIKWEKFELNAFNCPRLFPFRTKITFLDEEHRFLDKRIDISRVQQWLSTCSQHHSGCFPHESIPEVEIPNFRVIDVPRRCIAAMPDSIRYVALSYVWGQVDTYRLLRGNVKDLMKFDGLTRIWEKLPRTIRDVILFTEAIGERYLWIDQLCLIQDDDNDKMPGIKHMDVIYSRAFCTAVAASGEHANAGIPGWGIVRRRAQRVSEVLPGINVILTQSMSTYLRNTRYDERAWTFQEYFLSPRRIIFVNSQAYYLCRECYWREEDAELRFLNYNISHDESLLSFLNIKWKGDLRTIDTHDMLTKMLLYYTKRQLTFASDILNAMDGICRALSIRCKCSFFQGMPVAALDLYLLFHTAVSMSENHSHSENHSWKCILAERRQQFPSYSWAGWDSQIVFEDVSKARGSLYSAKNKSGWLSDQTWIIWYKYESSTGAVSLVWDTNQNPDFLEATEYDVGYRSRRSFRPKSASTRLSCNTEITRPSRRRHIVDQTQYSYPLLLFWTVSVYFNATFLSRDQATVDIFDRNGDYCGCAHRNAITTDFHIDESKPIELIILSETWKSPSRSWYAWSEIREHLGMETNVKHPKLFIRRGLFWALWICWDGGVAERVGIAQIFQTAIEESLEPGPVWKEVLLG